MTNFRQLTYGQFLDALSAYNDTQPDHLKVRSPLGSTALTHRAISLEAALTVFGNLRGMSERRLVEDGLNRQMATLNIEPVEDRHWSAQFKTDLKLIGLDAASKIYQADFEAETEAEKMGSV